jgi:dipeptide/tripeptide permease
LTESQTSPHPGWKFPRAFWTANIVELFERAAHYALFIALTLYLTNVVGFDDILAAWIGGVYSAGLYFLPPFTGAAADKMGFRRAIILAFALLSIGYFTLGALPFKATVLPGLIILMFGGSFIKSIITGTVAKTSDETTRARAFSIFYGMVNVGSFTGKSLAYPIRINLGLEAINLYAAGMTFLALVVVYLFYRNVDIHGEGKTVRQAWEGFVRIIKNARLLILILIVTGFWIIQHQMYATMPKYVLRTVGNEASPEWIANVNPFVVVTMVMLVTQLMRKARAITSIAVGMLLMPFSALCMASSPILESMAGTSIALALGIVAHPITVMLIAGIVVQGLAECFISPRYLEFFSLQAPKGEEGLYLGFSHLHSFFSSILGFGISGYLLTTYCPDPNLLTPAQRLTAYEDAHLIWYYFTAIGSVSAIALGIYSAVVHRIDQRKAAPSAAALSGPAGP